MAKTEEQEALESAIFGGDLSAFHENENEGDQEGEEDEEEDDEGEEDEETNPLEVQMQALQEQIQTLQETPQQLTQEQQGLIQSGQQIQNLQNNNPQLYNEMIQFAQNKMSGAPQQKSKNELMQEQIASLKTTIGSEEYSKTDTKPFQNIISLLEMQLQQNQELYNTSNATGQKLTQQVNELSTHNRNAQLAQENVVVERQLADLAKAEKDFGVKIKPDSRQAKQLVALVQGGENMRDAFCLVTGKKEVKPRNAEERHISTAKKGKRARKTGEQKALENAIFGENTSGGKAKIKYFD